jgi:hypothetical protein
MVAVVASTLGVAPSTPVGVVGLAIKGAGARGGAASKVVAASKDAAALLCVAGRESVVVATMPIKVTLSSLVWDMGRILCKEKAVAWGA